MLTGFFRSGRGILIKVNLQVFLPLLFENCILCSEKMSVPRNQRFILFHFKGLDINGRAPRGRVD